MINPEAIYSHGDYLSCDYMPGADAAAGSVIVVGELPLVAHRDLVDSELGALACGGGVYDCIAAGAMASGVLVYWDGVAGKVTTTAGALKIFGYVAPGSSAAQDLDTVRVIHRPDTP